MRVPISPQFCFTMQSHDQNSTLSFNRGATRGFQTLISKGQSNLCNDFICMKGKKLEKQNGDGLK